MGPDFNNDGKIDGYDMEYLDDSKTAGNAGCGDYFKLGCLLPGCLLVVIASVLSCLFTICAASS